MKCDKVGLVSQELGPRTPLDFQVLMNWTNFAALPAPAKPLFVLVPEDLPVNGKWGRGEFPFFPRQIVALEGLSWPFAKLSKQTAHFTVRPNQRNINLSFLPHTKTVYLIAPERGPFGAPGTVEGYPILRTMELELTLVPYFRALLKEPELRVQLWGFMGTGKSSFINTTFSSLMGVVEDNPNVRQWATVLYSEKTVTVQRTVFRPPRVNVALIDIWGAEENVERYPKDIWAPLLQGRLPDGFKMPEGGFEDNPSVFVKDPRNKPHALFVFVTATAVQLPAYMEQVTRAYREAASAGIVPVVILTQVDKLASTPEQIAALNNLADPALDLIIDKITQHARLQKSDIVPLINYTSQNLRNFATERAVYVALKKAFLGRSDEGFF